MTDLNQKPPIPLRLSRITRGCWPKGLVWFCFFETNHLTGKTETVWRSTIKSKGRTGAAARSRLMALSAERRRVVHDRP